MFRNEPGYFVLGGSVILLNTSINLFNYFITGLTIILDFPTRLNLNDSVLNSFNFFWTSPTYLSILFATLLIMLLLLHMLKYHTPTCYLLLVVYWLYSLEIIDFLVTNFNASCINLNHSSINLLLINNLNKYHPLLFYISVLLLTPPIYASHFLRLENNLFSLNSFTTDSKNLTVWVLVTNISTLFFGSWWALQEGTWGGWWNWDASEVFGLLITLFSIQNLHLQNSSATILQWITRTNITGFVLGLTYFFIQLNFELVSHNFGSKTFFFFYNPLFFLETLVIFPLLTIFTCRNLYLLRDQLLTLIWYRTPRVWLSLRWSALTTFNFLFSTVLVSSFLPLANYFVWNYFGINTFNLYGYVSMMIVYITLIISLTFTSYKFLIYVLLMGIGTSSYISITSLFLLLASTNWISSLFLHLSWLLSANINFLSWSISLTFWSSTLIHEELSLTNYLLYTKQHLFTCNTFFTDKTTVYHSNVGYCNLSSWNTTCDANAFNLRPSTLVYDVGTCFNYHHIESGWLNTSLYIETVYLNILLNIILGSLTLLVAYRMHFIKKHFY